MKKIICCFSFIGLLAGGNASYAQTETQKITRPKHEINIGFTDLFNRSETPVVYYYPPYYYKVADLSYFPPYDEIPYNTHTEYGLGYKFHFGKNALRVSFAFGMDDGDETEHQNNFQSTVESEASSTTMAYRIGYERTLLRTEKFDFYVAADFLTLQANNSYETTQTSADYIYKSKNESDYTESGGGLSLGARYFVHKNVSFSTETRVDYVSYTQEDSYENSSTGSYTGEYGSTTKGEGNLTKIKPLAVLSVNVHF